MHIVCASLIVTHILLDFSPRIESDQYGKERPLSRKSTTVSARVLSMRYRISMPLNPRSHSSTGLFVTTVRTPTRQRGMDWSSIAALDPCVWIVGGGGIPMRRNCKWARVRPKWHRHHNIRTGIETGGRAKEVILIRLIIEYWRGLSATRSLPNGWYDLLNG